MLTGRESNAGTISLTAFARRDVDDSARKAAANVVDGDYSHFVRSVRIESGHHELGTEYVRDLVVRRSRSVLSPILDHVRLDGTGRVVFSWYPVQPRRRGGHV